MGGTLGDFSSDRSDFADGMIFAKDYYRLQYDSLRKGMWPATKSRGTVRETGSIPR